MEQGNSRPLPRFSEPSAVYDKRTLTIKDRSATLSTVNGRVAVEYVLGDYQRSYLDDDDYEKRMGILHYREDEGAFYLHIVLLNEVKQREGDRIRGVDLNLKNVAVTSTGEFYDGGELLWGQNQYTTSESAGASKPKALGPQSRCSRDCRPEKTASSRTAAHHFSAAR